MSNSLHNVIHQAEQVILGKPHQIRLALACLLARGHLLIEDIPGVGMTTLAWRCWSSCLPCSCCAGWQCATPTRYSACI